MEQANFGALACPTNGGQPLGWNVAEWIQTWYLEIGLKVVEVLLAKKCLAGSCHV